jgi:hypothetical protein
MEHRDISEDYVYYYYYFDFDDIHRHIHSNCKLCTSIICLLFYQLYINTTVNESKNHRLNMT